MSTLAVVMFATSAIFSLIDEVYAKNSDAASETSTKNFTMWVAEPAGGGGDGDGGGGEGHGGKWI